MQEEYLALTFVANKVCTPRISGLVLHGIAVRQGFDHSLGIFIEDQVFNKIDLKLRLPHVAHIELLYAHLLFYYGRVGQSVTLPHSRVLSTHAHTL